MAASALSHLERRKIEAGVLIPMIKAFQQAMGVDKANEVARSVVREQWPTNGQETHNHGTLYRQPIFQVVLL